MNRIKTVSNLLPSNTFIYFYLYLDMNGVGMRWRNVFPFLTGNTNQLAGFGEVVVAMVKIVQLFNRKVGVCERW